MPQQPGPGGPGHHRACMRICGFNAIRACRNHGPRDTSTMTVRRVEAVQKDRV